MKFNKLGRDAFLALQWFACEAQKTVDDFLCQHRGQVLTAGLLSRLSSQEQQVMFWEQKMRRVEYYDLSVKEYKREIKHVPFRIMDLPPELRCMIWEQHMPLNNVPIDIADVLHDKRRLSRNAPTMLSHETRAESFDITWSKDQYVFRVPNGPDRTVSLLGPLARWLNRRGPDVVAKVSKLIICCSTNPPRGRWIRGQKLHFEGLERATRNIRQTHGFRWGGVVEVVERAKGVCGHACDDTRGHVVLVK